MVRRPRLPRTALFAIAAGTLLLACGEDPTAPGTSTIQQAKGGNPGKPGGGGGDGGSAGLSGSTLAGLTGPYSRAYDINDAGYIVGFEDLPNGDPRSFVWRDGVSVEVERAPGDGPHSIDDANVVLGYSGYLLPEGPMSWGSPILLALPTPEWTQILAQGIAGPDAAGGSWIVGYADDPSGEEAALRWRLENGVATVEEIPIPESSDPRVFYGAEGANRHGHVVGEFRVQVGNTETESRAFIWFGDPGTAPVLLPHPSGSSKSEAFAVNDHGVVVGKAEVKGNKTVPVRWTPASPGSAVYGVPDVLPIPTREGTATAVNNAGQIAGDLRDGSLYRGFLYDPADGSVSVLEPVEGQERSSVGSFPLLLGGGGVNCSGSVVGGSNTPNGLGQDGRSGAATTWAGGDGGC